MKPRKKKRTRAQLAADKKRTGRPPAGDSSRTELILLRVTPKELKAWRKAAKAQGLPLGPWLAKPRRDEMERGKHHG